MAKTEQVADVNARLQQMMQNSKPDPDLTYAYHSCDERAQKLNDKHKLPFLLKELLLIKQHVHDVFKEYKTAMGFVSLTNQETGIKEQKLFSKLSIEDKQNVLQQLSIQFNSFPVRSI